MSTNITARWTIVQSVPKRRSPEVQAAYDYLKDFQVGQTVHIDADSVSTAKNAMRQVVADFPEMKFKTMTAAEEDGGGCYIHKMAG